MTGYVIVSSVGGWRVRYLPTGAWLRGGHVFPTYAEARDALDEDRRVAAEIHDYYARCDAAGIDSGD